MVLLRQRQTPVTREQQRGDAGRPSRELVLHPGAPYNPLSLARESAVNVEIPSYLDDLHLLGRLDDVLATFTTLVERLESIGLTVNQAKTQLYAQRELSSEEMTTVDAAGIRLVPREEGIKLVGFPLGSSQYVASALESRLDTWQLRTDAIKSAATADDAPALSGTAAVRRSSKHLPAAYATSLSH